MRLANVCLAVALASCGDMSKPTIEIVSPSQLEKSRVLVRSSSVIVASRYSAISDESVRLLSATTFEQLGTAVGEPVWAGRASWRDTILRTEDPGVSPLVLAKADGTNKLVVEPPATTGWTLSFRECGETFCSFTWADVAKNQRVDVVNMTSLERVGGYERPVPAWPGVVDPNDSVIYHADKGLRLVAEEQGTGILRWTAPLDMPTKRRQFDMNELRIKVTGRGRYVLAIYGASHRDEFLDAELSVFEAATGKRVPADQARFAKLNDATMMLEAVPGTDNLLLVGLGITGGGETRDVGLYSLTEIAIPNLTTVGTFRVPKENWLHSHAPDQVLPLSSKRVLFAASR